MAIFFSFCIVIKLRILSEKNLIKQLKSLLILHENHMFLLKEVVPLKKCSSGKAVWGVFGGASLVFTQEVPTTNSSFFNLLCKDISILKRVCCMCKSSMRVFLISSTHTTVTAGSFTLGIKASCTLHETTI